ncbi:pilus assembly protein TadG-related protein [Corallococcus carmarthensis]|uniref:Pilus assembly protein n=1 Tax=Corallococcus carmarthensis TaxID=2316728 RepID=A0A3A8K8R5_9BACT|nr:pilus assembly protein TadG-related protein [Corallococcus carmarthensis]RKH00725.1 pilus assembly protein [Corallococcus carmarthensis]
MFGMVRRLRRDERGQALVLGAVCMLVVAVAVMSSVSIGQGVYEKIKLQDAADAQAYSLAVKEARAYNFLAYTNRAMIVHYNAMLTVMSYVSHAVYLDRTIGAAAKFLKVLPGIGPVFAAVSAMIKAWVKAVEEVAPALVKVLTELNIALWIAQEAMLSATLYDLYSDAARDKSIHVTDPRAEVEYSMDRDVGFRDVPLPALYSDLGTINHSNAKNLLHVLDDGPRSSSPTMGPDPTGMLKRGRLLDRNRNRLSDPDMAKYRLLMGSMANAVRREWTATGQGPVLIGRKWDLRLCLIVGELRIKKTADSQIKSFSERFEGNRNDQLFASDDIKMEVRPGCGLGFLDWSTVFELHFRVAADARNGFHQEYGNQKVSAHHEWKGITPFVTSDTSFVNPWRNHFGYPCNMVVLSKDMGAERGDGGPGRKKEVFQLDNLTRGSFLRTKGSGKYNTALAEQEGDTTNQEQGIQESLLDMTWRYVGGKTDPFAKDFRQYSGGMMAMSVGRAIYHRPGEWKEEPNFFNPVWTARLAPVQTHWDEKNLGWLVPSYRDAKLLFNGLTY